MVNNYNLSIEIEISIDKKIINVVRVVRFIIARERSFHVSAVSYGTHVMSARVFSLTPPRLAAAINSASGWIER